MANSSSDCIVSQMLEYMIELQGDMDSKHFAAEELMSQLILRKFQMRQEEEDRLVQAYEHKLSELNLQIEQMEVRLRAAEDENGLNFEVIEKYFVIIRLREDARSLKEEHNLKDDKISQLELENSQLTAMIEELQTRTL